MLLKSVRVLNVRIFVEFIDFLNKIFFSFMFFRFSLCLTISFVDCPKIDKFCCFRQLFRCLLKNSWRSIKKIPMRSTSWRNWLWRAYHNTTRMYRRGTRFIASILSFQSCKSIKQLFSAIRHSGWSYWPRKSLNSAILVFSFTLRCRSNTVTVSSMTSERVIAEIW